MCPNQFFFSTYEEVFKCVVVAGNNTHCRIAGLKRVRTKTFNRVVRALDEVRHVSNLKRNLISLSTFDSKGYRYIGECEVLKVSKDARYVVGTERSEFYIMESSIESLEINSRSSVY